MICSFALLSPSEAATLCRHGPKAFGTYPAVLHNR
ncbi:uncharacterized protein METZ01_LOCUS158145 [marine metagenome]|uniref:Uncharacterized protein n=1 Tax=marine metagenome TaxID=408172 RepID=A0A382AVG0_9ZZZZ